MAEKRKYNTNQEIIHSYLITVNRITEVIYYLNEKIFLLDCILEKSITSDCDNNIMNSVLFDLSKEFVSLSKEYNALSQDEEKYRHLLLNIS